MSLCCCFRRRWHTFKNIVYGYEEETGVNKNRYEEDPWQGFAKKKQGRHVHFEEEDPKEFLDDYQICSKNWCDYCLPKRQIYEAYGIEFETREERDAFKSKMTCMEKILEKELRDIRQQHMQQRKERNTIPLAKEKNVGKRMQKDVRKDVKSNSKRGHDYTKTGDTPNYSAFLTTDDNPLAEEISLVNEVQDVLDEMCNLSRELKDIEKILSIEVRERTLHPEPRLVHIKAPDDELSEQMKNDGGFRYCSSDSSVQRISYDTLPPPLTLSELLTRQPRDDDT